MPTAAANSSVGAGVIGLVSSRFVGLAACLLSCLVAATITGRCGFSGLSSLGFARTTGAGFWATTTAGSGLAGFGLWRTTGAGSNAGFAGLARWAVRYGSGGGRLPLASMPPAMAAMISPPPNRPRASASVGCREVASMAAMAAGAMVLLIVLDMAWSHT